VLHGPEDVAVGVTPEDAIIVDTKFAPNVPEVLALIRTVTDQQVKYVLNSHYLTSRSCTPETWWSRACPTSTAPTARRP
jgi:hypothetical protein